MGEVVPFPSQGVRTVPCHRIAEMYELQVYEDGRWRAYSIHYSLEDAKKAAANVIGTKVIA
ncbi:hypothetical protein X762_08965 [Mesorhizobium sp. LSHC426A00]|nr:hypothetical protein X762_08965 [Mesorhizobium sp. LSHC426A00]ESX57870.1 hypothetical protein X761_07875 [Mesorhizobium sp. LSHC424B00]ESX75393.1 hypothetical protein X758_04085 [Mesorhizobium sp. LSHC416B00]